MIMVVVTQLVVTKEARGQVCFCRGDLKSLGTINKTADATMFQHLLVLIIKPR